MTEQSVASVQNFYDKAGNILGAGMICAYFPYSALYCRTEQMIVQAGGIP